MKVSKQPPSWVWKTARVRPRRSFGFSKKRLQLADEDCDSWGGGRRTAMVPPVERRDELPPHMVVPGGGLRVCGDADGLSRAQNQPSVNTTTLCSNFVSAAQHSLFAAELERLLLLRALISVRLIVRCAARLTLLFHAGFDLRANEQVLSRFESAWYSLTSSFPRLSFSSSPIAALFQDDGFRQHSVSRCQHPRARRLKCIQRMDNMVS